jgi:hypothetical protein
VSAESLRMTSELLDNLEPINADPGGTLELIDSLETALGNADLLVLTKGCTEKLIDTEYLQDL